MNEVFERAKEHFDNLCVARSINADMVSDKELLIRNQAVVVLRPQCRVCRGDFPQAAYTTIETVLTMNATLLERLASRANFDAYVAHQRRDAQCHGHPTCRIPMS